MDKVSIVIPCFNDFQYVEESIESAFNQTYPNKEIIVVDDGSDLKTKSILKNLESKISKLIVQENKGASVARNVGVNAAHGEYVLVLDSDDYFESSFCSKAIDLLRSDKKIKIVTCYATRFKGDKIIDVLRPRPAELKDFLKYNQALGNSLFRRKDFQMAGGYDEKMNQGYEDWEFYIRLLKEGGRSEVIQEPLFYYRQKAESNSTRANKIKYDLLRYIYFKHKDLYIYYFEDFISHLLNRLEVVEKAEQKNLNKIEYKIGEVILKPFRFAKKSFKN